MVSLWICVNLRARTDNDKEYAGLETHELGIEPSLVTLMSYEVFNFNFMLYEIFNPNFMLYEMFNCNLNYFYHLTIDLRAGGQGGGETAAPSCGNYVILRAKRSWFGQRHLGENIMK